MNLLSDPLFALETGDGLESVSLPRMLAALGGRTVLSLPGLQRHQEDAFHIFLCYLAGAVLARTGRADPDADETFWHQGLLGLSKGDEDAWRLVVNDFAKPAFMQPPVPADLVLKPKASTPDELDVLVTAKNHDVKSARVAPDSPEAWAYALVSLQTMSGFLGQGNYGIARMNGGFGSRVCASVRYAEDPSSVFRDDVRRLRGCREELLAGSWGYVADGIVLTWLSPWDGNQSLALSSLDPFFVEIARIVRLVRSSSGMAAKGAPTECARIGTTDLLGRVGDPWVPIKADGPKALRVSGTGITPQVLRDLVMEDGYELQPIQRPIPGRESQPCSFRLSVLVRGKGRTEGFHQVSVRIPPEAGPRLFGRGPERDRLAQISKTGLLDAAAAQNKILRPALYSYLEAGPDSVNYGRREVSGWVESATADFSRAWGNAFFPWLWETVGRDARDAWLAWRQTLRSIGLATLRTSMERYPEHSGRRYRARVRAEGAFYGLLYRSFPELKEGQHGE